MRVPRGVINPVFPLLLVLMGVSISPFTAAAAGAVHQGGPITETDHGELGAESNDTVAIAGITVNESVSRSDELAFVWRAGPNGSETTEHRIDVAVSAAAADDHEVCLDSNACKPVRDADGVQVVSFATDADATNRTTFNVTLQRAADGESVDDATLTVWSVDRDADLDRDGVTNEREVDAGASLILSDTDGDGLRDERELDVGSDPTVVDTDGDGLDDARELDVGTDPTAVDTDGDDLADADELAEGTDPTAADTDDDGLVDGQELARGANATLADTDGDGLVDGREVALGANLTTADTDGDGLTDGREADLGSDPTVVDTDGDGLDDAREIEAGTDPTAVDSDEDGLADARELDGDTDPTAADTDDDGLADGREAGIGSDPTAVDSDEDGLADADELAEGTEPTAADTDGDYLADGREAEFGFDPTNPYTPALYGSGLVGFLLGVGVALSATDRRPVGWVRDRLPGRSEREDDPDPSPIATAVGEQSAHTGGQDSAESDDATARDVFERHQDALVTDAERTVRMLEAEGGQMKQSEIVASTSWSKAKVSRLLSRMDDDDEIVKVSIGRENLICLPDATPEPARQTDPGTAASSRLFGAVTGD